VVEQILADRPAFVADELDDLPRYGALREGWPIIVGAAALALPLAVIDRRLIWPPLLFAGAAAAFFRDPRRTAPPDPDCLYSAADGFILDVDEIEEPWFLGGRGLRIITFLSLFDVHVNRSPLAGTLVKIQHIDGGYAPAMDRVGAELNERQLLAIDGARGPVVVVQVAGLLARRIRRWVEPGATLRAGQKFGMIKFGSRTDVIIPLGRAEALVTKGARVRAGITPIARYHTGGMEGA
jgi:phosphatidylserine decarboxylase